MDNLIQGSDLVPETRGMDHLGLSVFDLDSSARLFVEALGWTESGRDNFGTWEVMHYGSSTTAIGDLYRQFRVRGIAGARKIYVCLADARAEKLGQLRVIDESGDDYLYPKESFVMAELSKPVRRAVLQAA